MRVKIAVVGAGSMGMNHLRVLKDFDEERVHIVGVTETNERSCLYSTSFSFIALV